MGPTALLPLRRKACWGFFLRKNPTASAGFERANLGTNGQHATPRPPKPILSFKYRQTGPRCHINTTYVVLPTEFGWWIDIVRNENKFPSDQMKLQRKYWNYLKRMYSFGSKYYNQTRPFPIILYIQNISLVASSPSTQQSNMKDFRIGCQLLNCEKIRGGEVCTAVILLSLSIISPYFTNSATEVGETYIYIYNLKSVKLGNLSKKKSHWDKRNKVI